ncbi:MAG: hypothetical protein ABIH01_00740 [Candidatus Omnitrophota bacterium]
MDAKLENKLKQFCYGAKAALGERLKAVIVHGSLVRGEYVARRSNVNLIVIVDKLSFDMLQVSYKLFHKYKKITRIIPFLFDGDYMQRLLGIFPVEFLDIKENYLVLSGEDPFAGLDIDKKHLRFQCEYKLKGNLIKLRQGYLEATFTRELKKLMLDSFSSVMAIFRSLIRLKGGSPPPSGEELMIEISRLCNLNEHVLLTLLRIKLGKERISHKGISFLYRDWVEEVDKLTHAVDTL